MNFRKYVGALIVFLTFLGVVVQQQSILPNQEIVLEFTDSEITPNDTQSTIALVKDQLQSLGAKNIQVKEGRQGKLRISYHSAINVTKVKNALSKNNAFVFEYSTNGSEQKGSHVPSEDHKVSCNLDIYEIHNDDGSASDFSGKSVLTVNYKGDRYNCPDFYNFCNYWKPCNAEDCRVNHKRYQQLVLEIQDPLHIIPEVRAGPFC
ncbi:hypothetical protein [Aestuariivivens sediminis]|uniref:hypothetical protein n=1 Tax=Aestuariivivens sediminis TaxID=2913557 RepID=UPI001F5712D4|nr:hypothetical protein [Aestuariivivens sediminis]